jgi:hypothetical protein
MVESRTTMFVAPMTLMMDSRLRGNDFFDFLSATPRSFRNNPFLTRSFYSGILLPSGLRKPFFLWFKGHERNKYMSPSPDLSIRRFDITILPLGDISRETIQEIGYEDSNAPDSPQGITCQADVPIERGQGVFYEGEIITNNCHSLHVRGLGGYNNRETDTPIGDTFSIGRSILVTADGGTIFSITEQANFSTR